MKIKSRLFDRFLLTAAPLLIKLILTVLRATMKIEVLHEEKVKSFWKEDKRMILVFWHGRLLMIPYCYKGKRIYTLISQHKDGELLARVMKLYGHESVRGSSTRGGSSALREMVRVLKKGDIAMTPDGPRGPRYVVQEGVITLARLTGAAIVPVTFAASRKKIFGSWDSFNLPHPFSRGAFLWGEPIYVGKEDDPERKRKQLETALLEMTDFADNYIESEAVKAPPLSPGKGKKKPSRYSAGSNV